MNRVKIRAPHLSARRPVRARRAAGGSVPIEFAAESRVPRWLVAGVGVLGVLVVVEFFVGVAVIL